MMNQHSTLIACGVWTIGRFPIGGTVFRFIQLQGRNSHEDTHP